MKKLLFIILIIVGFKTKAQIIDTAYKAYPSCLITPFLNTPRTDITQVERVEITQATINFSNNRMNIDYILCARSGTPIFWGNCVISGVDYATVLSGIKNGYAVIFSYLGTKINITYQ